MKFFRQINYTEKAKILYFLNLVYFLSLVGLWQNHVLYWTLTVSGQYGGLRMITRPIWKCPCINLYIYIYIYLPLAPAHSNYRLETKKYINNLLNLFCVIKVIEINIWIYYYSHNRSLIQYMCSNCADSVIICEGG